MNLGNQIAWEKECQRRGTERYYANQDRLREQGQGDTTDVVSYMIKDRLEDTADYLKELVSGGRGKQASYNKIIRTVSQNDYLKLAYIGLKCVLKAIQVKDKNTVLKITLDIASRIETDLKCQLFEAAHPAYYNVVHKSFGEQNVTDFTHMQKVMMVKFSEFELHWNDWSPTEKVQIGTRILRAILTTFGDVVFMYKDFNRGKTIHRLDTSVQFDEWSAEFEKERGLLYPMYLPLKVKPVDWTDIRSGGYYTPSLRLKFIKTKGKDHRDFVEQNIPINHLSAVNKMQATAWQINTDVLKVQEEIYSRGLGIGMPSNVRIEPPEFPTALKDIDKKDLTDDQKEQIKDWKVRAKSAYGREQQRKGQVLAFMQGHRLAKELQHWEELYFAYTCDFRGRIYCVTSGLSPQGADPAKGLLRFAEQVTLGKDGIRWLAIQGANTFGEDKLSYDERVSWIKQQEQYIRQVISDPITFRTFWGNADKPYQFLAFCFEWARCDYGRNPKAKGQLPVGLDGSCNGLQHFSAMLRDEVGGAATNLLPCSSPEDIYQQVANVTIEKLQYSTDHMARKWLQVGITRKCAKRPVMTLPYGATMQSARSYIMEYVIDNWDKFNLPDEQQWDYAKFLTPILWGSIGEVVIAARSAMDWLQKSVTRDYMKWLTPIDFPVYQYYKDVEATDVRTQLNGSVRIMLRDFDKEGEPALSNQRSGIAPNFVHSIDSTHMVMTINMTDFTSYAMIHDDFGTHAGNTQKLFVDIRNAFLQLYTISAPLYEWAEQCGVDRELPELGNYDINKILEADYFFG